jgi:dihydroxy-acid dehydratase
VIAPLTKPVKPEASIAVLRGNLAPGGAVIKPSAASPSLLQSRGRAVVFESIEDYQNRIDDPDLDVDPSCVLVLKGTGPAGYPGMPEVGNFPLPRKMIVAGVTDMVRVSDARMSGTAYGTCVLHVAPEAAVGGPLALVRNGDSIELDVPGRRLQLDVPESELAARRAGWSALPDVTGGYSRLYRHHVMQADRGVDFDFLVGTRGSTLTR